MYQNTPVAAFADSAAKQRSWSGDVWDWTGIQTRIKCLERLVGTCCSINQYLPMIYVQASAQYRRGLPRVTLSGQVRRRKYHWVNILRRNSSAPSVAQV
jgi:hypothetical protein